MLLFLPILMISLLLNSSSIVSAADFKPPTPAASKPAPTSTPTPASTPKDKGSNALVNCESTFVPLDEQQTVTFDRQQPEPAAYCGAEKGRFFTCALRSCINSPSCTNCANITSGPDDKVIKTDGKVRKEPVECALAYFINSNKSDADGSLCLTANADILQCTGACTNYTSCSTCLEITENK